MNILKLILSLQLFGIYLKQLCTNNSPVFMNVVDLHREFKIEQAH